VTDILQLVVGFAIMGVAFVAVLSYPGLQYSALRQWRGVWFVLGLVPLGVMGVVLALTVVAFIQGSNLWPILLIFTAPLATSYLLILRLIARGLNRGRD
jgi:hypothetical protein